MTPSPKIRVLFICIGNSCRSQMAEGFARQYASDVMLAASAGLAPAFMIAPDTVRAIATDWYSRYPTNYFLAEELGTPQIAHLAAEPERVLNVASEYMRLGRYQSALAVLSRNYPAVDAGQVEPGAVTPSENP